MNPRGLDYNNVNLISRMISTIHSRDRCDTSTNFCSQKLNIPIIASPMKDVVDVKVAKLIAEAGGFAILHRFQTIQEQVEELLNYQSWFLNRGNLSASRMNGIAASIGVNGDSFERFRALHKVGCHIFCIDVANGANTIIEDTINKIWEYDKGVYLIIGNVMSWQGFNYLQKFPNVRAIRVGVGGGSGCTTTDATGLYHPSLSLIKEIHDTRTDKHISIIADGGIKKPADLCKAIAFGADCVMIGGVLAASIDSPAEIWGTTKIFSGSASVEIQRGYRDIRYIEGTTKNLELDTHGVQEILFRFQCGLKSSMAYANSPDLETYRKNIEYIKC